METTHKPLHLDKWIFVQWQIMDIPTSCIWIIIFFEEASEYGSGSKFWGYVEPYTDSLCAEFRNFVQCHMFVSQLSCYY
jgi:hypothetical protein